MFTGLVEEVGEVKSARLQQGNLILEVSAPGLASKLQTGDSVNINGACQTAVLITEKSFTVNTIAESLSKTNLGQLKQGDKVNLELALKPDSRLGGHLVSGHIDCVGKLTSVSRIAGSWELELEYPPEFSELVVAKGSIAINGVSLTVTSSKPGKLGVSIIPHTWEMTNFPALKQGDRVNLEFDLIGKYIQNMIKPYANKANSGTVTSETFRRAGF